MNRIPGLPVLLAAGLMTVATASAQQPPPTTPEDPPVAPAPTDDSEGTGEPTGEAPPPAPPLRPIEPPAVGEKTETAQAVDPEKLWQGFPAAAQEVGRELIEKYGAPQFASAEVVKWKDNGPWKRTAVYREGVRHNFPRPHDDIVEQVVSYRVPVDMVDDLARFSGSLVVDRTRGELSSRCDSEAMNLLALNLAHDIVTGQRTVEQARLFHAQTAQDLAEGPTDNPYVSGLRFASAGETADPDSQLSPSM